MTPTRTTQTRRGRSRDAEASRRAILDAAESVFMEHGFHGARTGEIARRARVPQGLLYHYFQSKEWLFQVVMQRSLEPYFRSTIEMLDAHDGSEGLPLLEQAIRLFYDFLRSNPQVVRLMAWSEAIQLRHLHPDALDPEMCATPMHLGAQRIREAQAAGEMRSDIEAEHIIKMFLDMCLHWFMSFEDFCQDVGIDTSDAQTVADLHDRHIESIVRMVQSGVAPRTDEPRLDRSAE
jgi:TetR/AcrR family transcriptional regulator